MRRTSLFLLLALAGCAGPTARLESLACQRLELAPQVAWTKYTQNMAIHDPAREASALHEMTRRGSALGVPPETTRHFFMAQMEASRRLQREWILAWRKGHVASLGPARSLENDLRPRIDAIGARQIRALAHGARPPTSDQLVDLGARFLPKNSLSTPAHSSPSTPAVTSHR